MTVAASPNPISASACDAGAADAARDAASRARSICPGAVMLIDVSTAITVSGAESGADRAGEIRPRERQREQQQRGDPQREQQQLAQPAAPMLLHRRALQQADRRKIDHDFGLAMEQVQQDRHRRRDGADQEQRRQKGHARTSEHALARHQVRHQPELERLRRLEQAVVDAGQAELAAVERDQALDPLDVVLRGSSRAPPSLLRRSPCRGTAPPARTGTSTRTDRGCETRSRRCRDSGNASARRARSPDRRADPTPARPCRACAPRPRDRAAAWRRWCAAPISAARARAARCASDPTARWPAATPKCCRRTRSGRTNHAGDASGTRAHRSDTTRIAAW